ncbi:otefin-like [Musca vetustissima]|uniref:otefin-like n=1 Tax=Musca vetustissima TaxID=27455 RepID=UPI002AB6B210|nr:otefin-like [Musca vetustissima]
MIEFGMPNVPVTDSSRKILIRRLEAVMSGKPATTTTPNKTNRRETMHVSKPSEMASSAKITAAAALNNNNNTTTSGKPTAANRPSRRTIAATERHVTTTTTVSEPEYSDVSPDRGEVVLTQMLPPKAKTPEKPTLYPKLPAKEPSPKPQVLSKTGVVSTSYIQESSVNKTYAEPIDDIDSTEEEIEEEIMKKKPVSSVPSYSATSYVPLSESKVTTSASMPPLASTLSSSTRYSSLNSSYNYSGNTKPSSTTLLNNSTSTSVRKTYEPPVASAVPAPASRTTISAASTYQPRVGGGGAAQNTISARRSYVNAPDQEESPFRQFMMAMEEKYHLKQTFIIISVFIVAIFIYVFFIQSV